MIGFFTALIALAALVAPPQQTRLRDQVTVGTGSIIGTVTDERTGVPISSAVVTLNGTTRPAEPSVTTDGDGQFIFTGIAAGRYSVEAKRGGYFDGAFGQKQPLGPGATIPLDDGERRAGIIIALVKPAAIAGTVVDDAGEPVVKLEVRAYKRAYLGGRAHYSEAGSGVTDDRGMYRIGRLIAGDYLVGVPVTRPRGGPGEAADDEGAMPRDGGAVSQLPPAGNGKTQVFPSSYFPAGVAAPYATAVSVAFGESRRNVDLQIRPAPAFRISGAVLSPAGTKRDLKVRLSAVDEGQFEGSEIASIVVSDNGAFAVGGIPPGQYLLSAETAEAWASEVISVTDADLSDIRLQVHDLLRATGRLEFSGSRPEPELEAIQSLQLSVERASGPALAQEPVVAVDRTGRNFSITGLPPGRYVVRAKRGLPSWYLKAVMFQGRDVSQSAFEITQSDAGGLVATFTDRPSSITGTVTGAADEDAVVLVFPQDQQRWVDFGSDGRAFRAVGIRAGAFEALEMPTGDYVAVAVAGDASMVWREPSFLQAAARLGTAVRVADGANAQVDLKMTVIR